VIKNEAISMWSTKPGCFGISVVDPHQSDKLDLDPHQSDWIRIGINLQMTSQWNMSLGTFKQYLKVFCLYSEARIRIRIKVNVRIRIHIKVTTRISYSAM
jgi:hypothetical protein